MAFLGFLAVTAAVATRVPIVARIDHVVLGWGYRATYGKALDTDLWTAVARYGQPTVLRGVLVICGLFLLWMRFRRLAAWLVVLAVSENVVGPAAKYLLTRPRPHWLHPISVEHSTSYPSGHATAAGMFVTAMTLLTLTIARSRAVRTAVLVTVIVIGLSVSLDRIFLGVHYLSDVVGGVLLGAAMALAGWLVLVRTEHRLPAARVIPAAPRKRSPAGG